MGPYWGHSRSFLSIGKEVGRLPTKSTKRQRSRLMLDQTECVRLVSSQTVEEAGATKSHRNSNEYKLHIVMDKESFARLRWLKATLEASTESEVIRRALKAYEIFEPDDESKGSLRGPNADSLATAQVEHLYIRIPQRMKEQLDFEQNTSGNTYAEQVRQALRVFTQLVRDAESWKGKADCRPHSSKKGEVTDDVRSLKPAAVF